MTINENRSQAFYGVRFYKLGITVPLSLVSGNTIHFTIITNFANTLLHLLDALSDVMAGFYVMNQRVEDSGSILQWKIVRKTDELSVL